MMEVVGLILSAVGIVLALTGGVWLLIKAFQESVLWGLGSLLVPCVSLIFAITHWDEAKKPFLINLAGGALMVVGNLMMRPEAGM